MKAHQRTKARELYFNSGKNFEEIAAELDVHPRTLYRWARTESWDKFKQAALVAPAIAVDNIFTQLLALQKRIAARGGDNAQVPTVQEAEITRKLVVCITHMNKYLSLGMNMRLKSGFVNFINDVSPDHAMQLTKYADDYFFSEKLEAQPFIWQQDIPEHRPQHSDEDIIEQALAREAELYPSTTTLLQPDPVPQDAIEEDSIERPQEEPLPENEVEQLAVHIPHSFCDDGKMSQTNVIATTDISHQPVTETVDPAALQPEASENKDWQTTGRTGHFEATDDEQPPDDHDEINAIKQQWAEIAQRSSHHKRRRKRPVTHISSLPEPPQLASDRS